MRLLFGRVNGIDSDQLKKAAEFCKNTAFFSAGMSIGLAIMTTLSTVFLRDHLRSDAGVITIAGIGGFALSMAFAALAGIKSLRYEIRAAREQQNLSAPATNEAAGTGEGDALPVECSA